MLTNPLRPVVSPGIYPLNVVIGTAAGGDAVASISDSSGDRSYQGFAVSGSIEVTPGPDMKSLGGLCNVAGSRFCGRPINIGTGNMFEAVTDYATSGPNRLSFIRYYNSLGGGSSFAAALGRSWRSNYDRRLGIVSAGAVYAERADGQIVDFTLVGGTWKPDSDIDLKLVQSGASWTLVDGDDTVESYVQVGPGEAVLSAIRARNGYAQILKYSSSAQLLSVTDSYGRRLGFTYGKEGLLAAVRTPDGLVLSYRYSASGLSGNASDRLAGIAYSTTPATQQTYVYEDAADPVALTGIIDEDGNRFASWSYDAAGRATSSRLAGGAELTSVAYDDGDGSRSVTNPLGQQEVYRFATLQGVPKVTEIDQLATAATSAATRVFTYDANGYPASASDWNGNVTTYVNDARGLPTRITEAAGTPQQRVTAIAWQSGFHLPSSITAPGLTTAFTYDASGNLLTRTETDTTGNTVPYSTKGEARTTRYSWANFLPASTTDARGNRTRLSWDGTGALAAITNPLGQATRITKHLPGGLPQTIVDPNGVTTTLAYDARDRLLASTVATGSGPLTTKFEYDAAGNLIRLTLPDGAALANTYDAAHRLVAIADLLQNRIDYTLDAQGDRTRTLLSAGGVVARKHFATFDALGRLLHDIGGAGQTTKYAYDANSNPISVTDPLDRVTAQAFDALDRLTRFTDAAGGHVAIRYDAQDHPTQITDPNGNSTFRVYDGFGDLIESRSPDTGDTVFRYDADGNLVKRELRGSGGAALVTEWTYDALDRSIARLYPADPAENVAYFYDQPGAGFGIGRLTKVTDNAGTLTRSYDERGDALGETRIIAAAKFVTGYTYDAAGRIASIFYPSGTFVRYSRDLAGRINAVSAKPPGGSLATVAGSIAYKPFGPLASFVFGNGIAETRSYDLDYRLSVLADKGKSATDTVSYGYNAADDVLSIADNVLGNQSFNYDALDRLTAAAGPYGNLGYAYDGVGNLLAATAGAAKSSFAYTAHSNRLTGVKSGATPLRAFTYTAAGNIATDQQTTRLLTLSYNQDNRLASVENQPTGGAAATHRYLYDAFGQRLEKRLSGTPGALTAYQYDLAGHLLEEQNLAPTKSHTDYIYLGDRPIGMVTAGNTLAFYETGLLDTPQRLTGAGQGVLWAVLYQPYGQTKILSAGLTQNLRFPGQYADAETGYYHNGLRDYDPTLVRYLESDPIGIAGGLDTYAYAEDDPTDLIDPLGLDGWLTIASNVGGGFNPFGGGHSLILYTPDQQPGSPTRQTYIIDTAGGPPEILTVLGVPLSSQISFGTASRSIHISTQQYHDLLMMVDLYRSRGKRAWTEGFPCTSFAADVWWAATHEFLNPNGPFSNNATLRDAIIAANAGKTHGIARTPLEQAWSPPPSMTTHAQFWGNLVNSVPNWILGTP